MNITRTGVIGLGATGSTVARRLLAEGFEVTAHDRDGWTVATIVEAGARPARIPADAAEPADVVFVLVPDEPAADEVLFDCGGVGDTLRDGGYVVAASRTSSAFVLSAAERLRALGVNTVEAWFTSADGGAATTVFVGCSPQDLATVAPALEAVAVHVVHVGPLGSVSALRSAGSALRRPPAGAPPRGEAIVRPGRHRTTGRAGSVPAGVLTLDELMDMVSTVRRRGPGPRPASFATAVEPPTVANCLDLASSEFEDVITELERHCGIPLLREAARCSTPGQLVSLINTQMASGV